MGSVPRFSVVVPTRDRPEFLARCLRSAAAQTFDDFEVVVCDNPTERSARSVVEDLGDSRFTYIVPPAPLSMPDNWELAVSNASGEYVTVLLDKFLLHPTALEATNDALTATDADHVSWRGEGYHFVDESRSIDEGLYYRQWEWSEPELFDPHEELQHRLSMSVRLADEGVHYFRGKICFGVYSRSLIERIRHAVGRLFPPLNPDYTSMVASLSYVQGAVDLGRPCVLWVNSVVGTGYRSRTDAQHIRRYILGTGGLLEKNLPIPGLYSSVHNCVAYDIVASIERAGSSDLPPLDLVNLTRRAREDLSLIHWPECEDRDRQYTILERFEHDLGLEAASRPAWPPTQAGRRSLNGALRDRIGHHPRLHRTLLRLCGRDGRSVPRHFASGQEAVAAADFAARPN